jgi:hypothetical protein
MKCQKPGDRWDVTVESRKKKVEVSEDFADLDCEFRSSVCALSPNEYFRMKERERKHYKDMEEQDLTVEERKDVPDSALTGKYDTLQDLALHAHRENAWVDKVSEMVVNSGLLIVGLGHVLSLGEKLRALDFEVEAHVYDPNRIYKWAGRPTV